MNIAAFLRGIAFILTLLCQSWGVVLYAAEPDDGTDWYADGQAALQARLERQPNTGRARNIILMISDGHGVGTNYATRLFVGQRQGGSGDDHVLPFETPAFHSALVKTYNTNAQTPDSAGTATAIMSGVKTRAGVINVSQDVVRGDCSTLSGNLLTPLSRILSEAGKSVGAVSTAGITHATPATVYASSADRNWESRVPDDCEGQVDIAQQLLQAMQAGDLDIAMGGGRRNFVPEGAATEEDGTGVRVDQRHLINEARQSGVQYAWNQETFAALHLDGTPALGLFEDGHMQYEADREDEPSLAEMTEAAIRALSVNEAGFFLQVEAGRVDHAHHAGNLARTLHDAAAFAEAVAVADRLTDDRETLLIVTADHEHAIAFNGYCGRGSDILGLCMGIDPAADWHTGEPNEAADGKPYTVAGYLNGAGSILLNENLARDGRPQISEEELGSLDYMQQALIPLSGETHSGEDVPVYAKGPFAHLLDGTVEQNYLFHVMLHAASAEVP
ncbi:MAG: alkaline phosphatase [Pseudomonadota bacterium]